MKDKDYLYIRIAVATFLLLVIGIKVGIKIYNNHMKYERLKEQGVYEIENSYIYVEDREKAYAFFMIYEPMSDIEELKEWGKNYLVNNGYQQILYDREDCYAEYPIMISFIKPSDEYKYGWQGPPDGGVLSSGITKYEVLFVVIPNSTSTPDEWIFLCEGDDMSILNELK